MEHTKGEEQKLDKGLGQAYDYISNVIITQRRPLSLDDMYKGYSSMGFKPTLTINIFEDYYYQILSDWERLGLLKTKEVDWYETYTRRMESWK